MQVVGVDVIGPEPAEARLAGGDERRAGEVAIDLGGDDRPVAPAFERPAEHLLRPPVGIAGGGVDEVDAGVERRRHHLDRLAIVLRAPHRVAAEGPGAERDARDLEVGTGQHCTFHRSPFETGYALIETAGR